MFQNSIRCVVWYASDGKIAHKHHSALKLLISEEIAGKAISGEESTVPQYILRMWHHMLARIHTVEVEWNLLTKEKDGKHFGYKRLCPLFCNANVSSLDFTAFVKLMPNLKRISLFNSLRRSYAPSIELDT